MNALDELLDRLPPGAHVRIVKARRYPNWNPWRVVAYRHEVGMRRRGWRKRRFVELGHADAGTMLEAARCCLLNVEPVLDAWEAVDAGAAAKEAGDESAKNNEGKATT